MVREPVTTQGFGNMPLQVVDVWHSAATVSRPPVDHVQKPADRSSAPMSRETLHNPKVPYSRRAMHVLPAGTSSATSAAK